MAKEDAENMEHKETLNHLRILGSLAMHIYQSSERRKKLDGKGESLCSVLVGYIGIYKGL